MSHKVGAGSTHSYTIFRRRVRFGQLIVHPLTSFLGMRSGMPATSERHFCDALTVGRVHVHPLSSILGAPKLCPATVWHHLGVTWDSRHAAPLPTTCLYLCHTVSQTVVLSIVHRCSVCAALSWIYCPSTSVRRLFTVLLLPVLPSHCLLQHT